MHRAMGATPAPPPTGAARTDVVVERIGARRVRSGRGDVHVATTMYAPDRPHADRCLSAALERDGGGAAVLAGEADLADFDPRRALFFDIETTGLSHGAGTLPFLIGGAHFCGDRLVLEQWFLASPEDEGAILEAVAARIAEHDFLVTFNGRSFDIPVMRGRFAVHHIPDPTSGPRHLDLLHGSRRLLGHRLPDCRLATVERHILGLLREEDLPGSEAPAAYHDYLHGDAPDAVCRIVAHNRDDVLSLATLCDELLLRVERPESTLLRDPESALAIADLGRRVGHVALARRIYEAATTCPSLRDAGEAGLRRLKRAAARAVQRVSASDS